MKEGLFDDRVTRALTDDAGNLWMGCPRGVFRVPIEQIDDLASGQIRRVEYVAYGVSDGMKSSECSHGAQTPGCRAKDGSALVSNLKRRGVDRFPPLKDESVASTCFH